MITLPVKVIKRQESNGSEIPTNETNHNTETELNDNHNTNPTVTTTKSYLFYVGVDNILQHTLENTNWRTSKLQTSLHNNAMLSDCVFGRNIWWNQ